MDKLAKVYLLVFLGSLFLSCEKDDAGKAGAPSVNPNTQVEFTIFHEYNDQGTIRDSLLSGASIKLYLDAGFASSGAEASRTGTSNDNGIVIFGNLPESIYTYEVEHEQMITQVQTISIAVGNLSKYNIYMLSN